MTIFFLVVGLEIKRELTDGHLSSRRAALLPAAAALGGMVAPALVYLAIAGSTAPRGWAIPMATDIALAVWGARCCREQRSVIASRLLARVGDHR